MTSPIPQPHADPVPRLQSALGQDLRTSDPERHLHVHGPHRFIEFGGRRGFQPLSLSTSLEIPSDQHCRDHGSIVLWLMPLESLHVSPPLQHVEQRYPDWQDYRLLSDRAPSTGTADTIFAWYWRSAWHPQMVAKWMSGPAGNAAADFSVTPYVPVEHMPLVEREWAQLVLTWDKPASDFRIYLNGILCGTTRYPFVAQQPHPTLYLGNPAMAFADLSIYDRPLSAEHVAALGATAGSAMTRRHLLELYTIGQRQRVDWAADDQWQLRFSSHLTRPGDFDGWRQQGCTEQGFKMAAHAITPEGLLLETPEQVHTESRVYFWSPEVYEGDLAVDYEFRPEKDTGLALLVIHAAGMHGEDFIADHPARTTGAMATIIADQVKNYHWEYFRHAVDVRNDLGTQLLAKNPWCKPLGMRCLPVLAVHQWHKLLFVKEGKRLRCAINGDWVIDVQDDPDQHCGPVLHAGRVGLRLMYGTRLRFKNLSIRTRNPIKVLG